ncbi:MAG: hypothetical protein M3449_02875 [Acidobacteriota bacterium]|nr:hypothetical protein [Blastocatellia bacterium]MDQ3221392.1 hypothetical protein [Acidobacteriota bacterium]MDQ3489997.1 hypothetical protein [Acidobacteriota bacterium]
MLTIEGTYKDGKIVLNEAPLELTESKVLVTFLRPIQIDLSEKGIGKEQAAKLGTKLNISREEC